MAFFPSWIYHSETMANIPKPHYWQLSTTQVKAEKSPRQLLQYFFLSVCGNLFPAMCSGIHVVAEGHFKGPGCFVPRAEEEFMSAILEFYPARSSGLSIKGWDAHCWGTLKNFHTGEDFSRDDLNHIQGIFPSTDPREGPSLAKSLSVTAVDPSGSSGRGGLGL